MAHWWNKYAYRKPRWARDGGNGWVDSLSVMNDMLPNEADAKVKASGDALREALDRAYSVKVEPTFTIDVQTVDGWRRLSLTRDQARSLIKELGESVLRSEA